METTMRTKTNTRVKLLPNIIMLDEYIMENQLIVEKKVEETYEILGNQKVMRMREQAQARRSTVTRPCPL